MRDIAKIIASNLSLNFAYGCFGRLFNNLTVWVFGYAGTTAFFNVEIAPNLSASWLYPRIVWGGIWRLLFLLHFYQSKYIYKGILLSLIPTLVQLFIVLSFRGNIEATIEATKEIIGIELGILTPIFVVFFNFFWGITTALWLKTSK